MSIKVTNSFKFNTSDFLNQYNINLLNRIKKKANKSLSAWQKTLRDRLNNRVVPTSIIEKHKIRPNAPFPHFNTGKLRDSIKVSINEKFTKNINTLTLGVKIGTPDSRETFTNLGFRKRKSGQSPDWVGWIDRVLGSPNANYEDAFLNRLGNQVPSFYDVVNDILKLKDTFK